MARSLRPLALLHVGRSSEDDTAAGIDGIILGAAVMAASHALSAVAVIVAVLITLTVYWGAERYARIVAGRIHDGRRPDRRQLRSQLTRGWAMVSATVLPLGVLIAARLLGAELTTAVLWALGCSALLLGVAGWEVGRDGKLTTRERLASAGTAAAFGGVLILLKILPH